MNEHLWEIVVLIVTNLFTGGFIHIFTLNSTKRKENATASQLENIANQESEKAQSQKLNNTENVIKLYKEALTDIKELNEREKAIMMDTIKDQDRKLNELNNVINLNKDMIHQLQDKVTYLSKELASLLMTVNIECKLCPQSKLGCLNPKFKLFKSNEDDEK